MSKPTYDRLPIDCDLTDATLNAALCQNPPMYLHVHPSQLERATVIAARPNGPHGTAAYFPPRAPIIAVADNELGVNEWYLVSTIGSNPP